MTLSPPPKSWFGARASVWIAALLFAAICWTYREVPDFQFLNYDDDAFIRDNPRLEGGLTSQNLVWAATANFGDISKETEYWMPVTLVTRLADITLSGRNPAWHHLSSLLIHALNATLVFLLVREATGSLGIGALLVTLVSGSLQAIALRDIDFLGHTWSLRGVSGVLLYLLGFVGEVFVLTSIYLVMPAGRLKFTHALMGGVTAAALWEITRHVLTWYFATLSQVSVVYGSLTTAIIVLLSLEFAAILLLFGAQVIAEYERVARERIDVPAEPLRTG